jgi:DNA-binding transcriptional MerR regulator
MDKASGAYRTISEVAEDLDIPQHVLRFWETRFPQIKPMKRSGGRRYYRPGDVLLLRGIRRLLYGEGYTIKGVQRILSSQGIGVVQQAGGASGEEMAAADMEEEGGPAMGTEDELPSRQDEEDEGASPLPMSQMTRQVPEEEVAARVPETLAQETLAQEAYAGEAPVHEASVPHLPPRSAPALSLDNWRVLQGALDELRVCARHLDALRESEPSRRTQ